MPDRQEVEAVEAVVEKASGCGGLTNWQIERVAVDAIAALDRVRVERAEGMVKLADVLAFLRGTHSVEAFGHNFAGAAEALEAEFGEATDG